MQTKSWKIKVIGVIILLGVGLSICGYFWYNGVIKRDEISKMLIENNNKYTILLQNIANEQERCQQLITKNTGVFADFEYCKQYLVWSDSSKL